MAALWTAAALALSVTPVNGNDWPRVVLTTGCVGLVIAWSTNLYNFMDGIDGLAATMGAIGFAAYGFAALAAGPARIEGIVSAPALLALAAAILPFLAVNRPRASMFLGDVGAVPLGFLAAAFGVAGVVYGMWPAWFPLLVFLPFIADATLTLLRRIATPRAPVGRSPLALLSAPAQLGAGHGGTLATYALLMVGTAGTALACRIRAPL